MDLIHLFYVQNLDMVVFEMVAAFFIWTVFMLLLKGKAKKFLAFASAVLSIIVILVLTVYKRHTGDTSAVDLIPFSSFVRAQEQVEFYRTMLMNICLFLPLGLSLPYALSYKFKHNIAITIGFALILSTAVEAAQFFFRLGLCETDDVIMNVLGAVIGILSFLICNKILKYRDNHIHRHIEH